MITFQYRYPRAVSGPGMKRERKGLVQSLCLPELNPEVEGAKTGEKFPFLITGIFTTCSLEDFPFPKDNLPGPPVYLFKATVVINAEIS